MRQEEQVKQINKLITRLDEKTNVDIGGLRKNPTEVYVDPEIAAREWESFFRSHPQMIGMSADLPGPGSFLTLEDFGTPVLATRNATGEFKAFVNACRHRGALLETRERGEASNFKCPFHGWTYSNEGALRGVARPGHFGNIDKSCHGLIELPAVESHGMLFVHPDPKGMIDLEEQFGPELSEELALWNLEEYEYHGHETYFIDCNWKLAMDTFGETYHFPTLHENTINMGFHGNVQCYDTYRRNHRMLLCKRDIDAMRHQPESEWKITTATLPAYWLFPNVQVLPSEDALNVVRAYPVPGEPGKHVSQISFYLRPGRDGMRQGPNTDMQLTMAQIFARIIRDEDYVMSASQQRTANSGALPYVVFGRNEPALHHYHSTYREALGMKPLPLLADDEV